ncbi:MAG: FAD-dependent oxidoreductase [Candidatus Acidiferrales bacterium]
MVGGGVIGVCAAYYIAAAGGTVTLVERDEICEGCSYGNAGLVVLSHSIPLAAPGVFRKALLWLFDSDRPFYIKPRLDLDLLRWLWCFAKSCTYQSAREAIPILRDLTRASIILYRELAAMKGLAFGYEKNGLLVLYSTSSGREEGRKQARLLQEFEIESQDLSPTRARQFASTIKPNIAGGTYYPEDYQLIPADFVRGLAKKAESMGVRICPSTSVESFETADGKISAAITSRGTIRPCEVVLACGAWSPALLRTLKAELPVQPAKGYSVTFKRAPQMNLLTPLLLHEAKAAVTPMGEMVRLAGTLELAGLESSINHRRVVGLLRSSQNFISGIQDPQPIETWAGLRPCTPDGLPVVGRLKQFRNLIVATGHGMLGLTLGPITGKLVSELVRNDPQTLDTNALTPGRFK